MQQQAILRVARRAAAAHGPHAHLATRRAILLRDFELKGRTEPAGTIVDVAGGYLRNYLLPRSIAVAATRSNVLKYGKTAPEPTRSRNIDKTIVPSARSEWSPEESARKFTESIHAPRHKPRKNEHGVVEDICGFGYKGTF